MNTFSETGRIVLLGFGLLVVVSGVVITIISLREGEQRAARRVLWTSLMLGIFLSAPFLLGSNSSLLIGSELGFFLMIAFYFLLPDRRKPVRKFTGDPDRVDERVTMFSRAGLVQGTVQFEQYYRDHPEHIALDDHFRLLPGLLSEGAQFDHPWIFKSADSTFRTVKLLHQMVDGPVNPVRKSWNKEAITRYIKEWMIRMGASSAGITGLKPSHLYTVGGRQHNYGEEVVNHHAFAIAFTVEMNREMVRYAPRSPIIMESSAQYLRSGEMAVVVADFIRSLGYSARAHIDGNYQVRCPLVARDAGLGELGRMNLLMTPRLGPRVRIAVITTDLPVVAGISTGDPTMIEFCRICKKCAETCPATAISHEDIKHQFGATQWVINQERCFTYWCQTGTDCGRCMAVCPFSHDDNRFHNIVRCGIRQSTRFRRLAWRMDDFFYGRKPPERTLPEWMKP